MKRICTCLLAAALVVGAFTGCAAKPAAGTDTTTKQETTTETTTVTTTVVSHASPTRLTGDNWLGSRDSLFYWQEFYQDIPGIIVTNKWNIVRPSINPYTTNMHKITR